MISFFDERLMIYKAGVYEVTFEKLSSNKKLRKDIISNKDFVIDEIIEFFQENTIDFDSTINRIKLKEKIIPRKKRGGFL